MLTVNYSDFAPQITAIVRTSIEENFFKEGRTGSGIFGGGTTMWRKSKRAIKQTGKTLQSTGQLAASISVNTIISGSLTIDDDGNIVFNSPPTFTIEIGSNKPYAAIHQFGGEITRTARSSLTKQNRSKSGKFRKSKTARSTIGKGFTYGAFKIFMPARPYLVLQDEDIDKIQLKFVEWLSGYFI